MVGSGEATVVLRVDGAPAVDEKEDNFEVAPSRSTASILSGGHSTGRLRSEDPLMKAGVAFGIWQLDVGVSVEQELR